MQSKYWVNNVYSLGFWLKDYAFYPKSLPLYTYMDHGMTLFDTIPNHEIDNDASVMFKFSPRLTAKYKEVSKKPVYCLLNPAIHYRKKYKIEQHKKASGTLFFVGHSTPEIDDHTNWEHFISKFKAIPEQFQPVDICLHHHDVVKGLGDIFKTYGFKVLCTGNPHNEANIKNFYSIIKNYKYTMSNMIGSYTFYSVEMGIPFSLYGEEPVYYNKADKNVELGTFDSYRKQPSYQHAVSLFNTPATEITNEQKKFVENELGKNNTISRSKVSYLVYKALIKNGFKNPQVLKLLLIEIIRKIKRMVWDNGIKKIWAKTIGKLILPLQNYNSTKKDILNVLVNKNYITRSELYRLKFSKESITSSVLLNKEIHVTDSFWYRHSLNEIFIEETYHFLSKTDSPLIIDCGSNMGLSIIYFKKLYPKAKIIGFEPDGDIYNKLLYNVNQFKLSGLELYQKAVWINNEPLLFAQNGSLGGHLTETDGANTIKIETYRLKDLLEQKVDFLKIDIEGAEFDVLKDCEEKLSNVSNLFIEYHSFHENEQMIGEMLVMLKRAGFKVYVKEAWENMKKPFVEKKGPYFDLQLNIFGYRR